MMAIWLHGQPIGALKDFISHGIWGERRDMPGDTGLAVFHEGRCIGGVVYQNYCKVREIIEISVAASSARWLTRPVLWEMFSYPFDQLGCQSVIFQCDPENTRLRRIAEAYGFEGCEIPRLGGRDKAMMIYVLGDDQWRSNGFHKEQNNG